MPSFLVKLVQTAHGRPPFRTYADGIIVSIGSNSAYDAVVKANDAWASRKQPGEVYEITPCAVPRTWHVSDDGLLCSPAEAKK